MTPIPSRARRWPVRALWAVAALAVLAAVLAVLVHTPPARRAVLRRTIAALEERFNLALDAGELRYNLFALRVTLGDVRLAAVGSREDPFLTADTIEISVPRAALFGPFSLRTVRAANARLAILRRADGTTNLPSGSGAGDASPSALPIDRLVIPRLAVALTDDANGVSLALPALAVDVGSGSGTVQLEGTGRLQRGRTETTIARLGGGVTFDGRAVTLTRFAAAAGEADVVLDGRLALLVDEPRADLRFDGSADVAGIARWAMTGTPPTGRFAFDGTVDGPFAAPAAAVQIRDGTVTVEQVTVSDVNARLRIEGERLAVAALDALLADGRISAAGDVPFDTGEATVTASWSDLDAGALVRALAPAAKVVPAARATGNASLRGPPAEPSAWTVEAETRFDPGRSAPGQVAVSGEARLRLDDRAWQLEAAPQVAATPVRARLRGVLDAGSVADSTVTGTIDLPRSEIDALLASLRSAGLVDRDPEQRIAGRLQVETVVSGTISRPRLQITAQAAELAAAGVTDVAADLTAEGTLEQMSFAARLRQDGANVVVGSGTVWPEEARLEARLSGTLNEPARLVTDVPIGGVVNLALDASGPFDALTARGTIAVEDARYDAVRAGRLDATLAVDPAAVQLAVTSDEFGANAAATVSRGAGRLTTIDVQVDRADLARIVRDAELPVPVSGRVSLRAQGEGPLDDWRQGTARIEVSQLDAIAGELPFRLAAPARFGYRSETIDVETLEAAVGQTGVSVAGRLPAFADAAPVAAADALRAVLVGDVAHALSAVRATGLVEIPDVRPTGPFVLLARVTGSAERPAVAGDLELGPGQVLFGGSTDQDPPYLVDALQVRAHVENGWLDLLDASGAWQGSRISAQGRAPLRLFEEYLPEALADAAAGVAGPAVLTARAQSITASVLAPFVSPDTLARIDGSIDASAQLSATSLAPEDLSGEVRLDALAVRVADLPVAQREPTRIVFEEGFARIAAWDWIGQGASLGVQGQVRLSDRDAVIRAAGRLDLRMLTPFVREAGLTATGTLTPLVAVTGPLDDPAINAEITLADAGLRLAEPRVIATGLSAKAVVSQLGTEIVALTGSVNGGALTGGGRVAYGGSVPPSAQLGFEVAGMALEFPEGLRSELDADLDFALADLDTTPRGTLSGTITVLRSAYREPLAVVTGLLAALRSERLTAAAAEPDSLADRLTLDVRVVTDTDVIVDNNLARLQLGADLRAIGTAAAPALSGRAALREGGELFLGRNRYSIESGTIDFENPLTVEPDMNVRARTRVGGEEIELTLDGTPETLAVGLRSVTTPELGQADVASLLLTGRTLDDVSGAEGQIVGEQVLSYLSGDVLGAASRVVGLDTIRLGGVEQTLRRDPSAIATETDPTSRLTFGKSIGDQLEVTLSQSLRNGDAQTWIVDYRPISPLALRLVSRDDNLRGYEFRHDVSFGPAAARTVDVVRPQAPEARVTDVALAGSPGALEGPLREALRLDAGDIFDFTEWQRDRDRLEQLLHARGYREARVRADRREEASVVALRYDIDAGPPTEIVANGHTLTAGTLQAIEAAWTQSVFDDFLEEEAADIVRRALGDEGYLQPEVTAEISSGDTKRLTIAVAPGERIADRRLVIAAADEALAREIDRWLRGQGLAEVAWRDPAALERAITTYLRSRGHVVATAAAASAAIQGRTGVLTVDVEPGPVFAVGDVRFMGVERLAADTLQEAADLASGSPYDPVHITDARARVVRRYRAEGFADARVSVQQNVAADVSRVDVVFAIEEGPRQVLREVSITGNRSIDTDVVTRALDLTVGEPLGADDWLQARGRLFDTALFRRVDVTTVPVADAPATPGERPVAVRAAVQEWPALRMRYGFQLSEERPEGEVEGRDLVPGLSADLTRRTLFGRAVTTGAVLQYQRRDRTARLFANAPTMFGLPIESLVTGYRSRQEFTSTTLLTDRTGVSWEQRMRVTPALRLSYSYAFDRDHTFETEPDPDSIFPEFDVTVNVARLNAAAVFDTRDDPLDTARGLLLSSSLDYSAGSLGSDVSFVGHLAQAYYFRPWRQVVFASAARLGLAKPLAGQRLIYSERYFAGGARTVRGVKDEGLGPRDFEGGAEGGGALVVLNQEVRFPIFRWVRGVAFTDAGNVFTAPSAIDLGELVGSVGAGLRVTTPFALLRVDYGRVWTGTDGSSSGRWTFGIGQTF